MVEIAPEFIEAMPMWQMFFQVAEMILAKLCCGVALGFQDFRQRDVFLLQSGRGAGCTHCGQARAHRQLAGDERRPSGGATRLGVE